MAVAPPYELPTKSHLAIPAASIKPSNRLAADDRWQSNPESHSEKPAPGMSGENTSAFWARAGITSRQLNEYPKSPCTSTNAGPEPACQNRIRSPFARSHSSEQPLGALGGSPYMSLGTIAIVSDFPQLCHL